MKAFLKKPRAKNWANAPATEPVVEFVPPPTRSRKNGYLAANCVVLAAAVFGVSSWAWAKAMLPSARQLDARRVA